MATRDPVYVEMAVRVAKNNNLVPWEFLGGLLAEGFNPFASRPARKDDWRKYWDPPEPRFDVSFGFGQKNVRYSHEYAAWCDVNGIDFHSPAADVYPGDDVISAIRDAYILNPEYAMDVAAKGYRNWRYDPEVKPLHAWSAYNGPVYYKGWTQPDGTVITWRDNPNVPHYAESLEEARQILGEAAPYNPHTRLITQNDDWSCFPTSVRMALESYGRAPTESWIEGDAVNDSVVSTQQGLLDATGRVGAEWISREYSNPAEGTPTLEAYNIAALTWESLKAIAGRVAVVAGGRRFGPAGHWVFVRSYDAERDVMLLGNPGGSSFARLTGIDQEMTEAQFNAVGPWSAVAIYPTDDVPVLEPVPATVVEELTKQITALRAELDTKNTIIGYLTNDVAGALQAAVNTLASHKP